MRHMIESLADVDAKRVSTIKWQLWTRGTERQCVRLNWALFKQAYLYAERLGFRTTASVFDVEALRYLLTFDVPFVKIANRPYLRHLSRYVPRGIPIVYSVGSFADYEDLCDDGIQRTDPVMLCISQYPAHADDYKEHLLELTDCDVGISDHTIGFDLWRKYHPEVYEKHLRLESSTGPDAGPWAATPSELKEVLDYYATL